MAKGEWAPDSAGQFVPLRHSFRALIAFWLVLLGAMAGGAVFLQIMGKMPPGPVHTADDIKAIARATAEASTHKPAPALPPPLPPGAIPGPNADLLAPAPGHPDLLLPKIGTDGKKAATYYAAKVPPLPPGFHGRLGLVVDGIGAPGVSDEDNQQAIKLLPPSVDLAISAYAPDAARLADAARAAGHECLVSIPMQPGGSAAANEGDLQLLSGDTPEQRTDKLNRALAHTQGCVGATGASDGKDGDSFAQSAHGVTFVEVLDSIHKTGLFYFDPRTSGNGRSDLWSDIVLDRNPNSEDQITAETIATHWFNFGGLATEDHAGIGLISLGSLVGPGKVWSVQELADKATHLYADGLQLLPLSAILAMPAPKTDPKPQ